MRTRADRRVWIAGLLAICCLASNVDAKTIIVNSDEPGFFVKPERFLIDHAISGSRATAIFKPVSTTARMAEEVAGSASSLRASFSSPVPPLADLYEADRRPMWDEPRAGTAAISQNETSMTSTVQQGDFRIMLLVGAVLIAQQLRRKHRSLKQSMIAG